MRARASRVEQAAGTRAGDLPTALFVAAHAFELAGEMTDLGIVGICRGGGEAARLSRMVRLAKVDGPQAPGRTASVQHVPVIARHRCYTNKIRFRSLDAAKG